MESGKKFGLGKIQYLVRRLINIIFQKKFMAGPVQLVIKYPSTGSPDRNNLTIILKSS